jgi:outer membrane protein assembly factor BamB
MLTNDGLTAVDADSGKLLFDYPWEFEGYRVVQPLVLGSTDILLGTGMGTGTRRMKMQHDDSGWQPEEVWTSRDMKPDFNDYVVQGDYLFGFDHNLFACVDLNSGKRTWKKGRYGNGQVLSLPDGDQLLVLSETGEVVILHANGKAHEELGRFPALSGKTWNHPVLVGNRLYVRNGEEAACFELGRLPNEMTGAARKH